MDAQKVTIVTPSYNQGHYIRATIESVLSQDYPDIEYLIMDGGSTDATSSIAASYSSLLTFVSEPDRGQSHAINKGFRRARGTIVAWLNSDDILLPGAVTKAVAALHAHPEAAAVYGEGYRIDHNGRRLGRFSHTEPFNLWKLIFLYDYVLQQSLFLRREAVAGAGYLDESLHYTMDWDLLIRLGKLRPLLYVPEFLGAIREYPEAKSFSGGDKRIHEIRNMLRRHTGSRFPPGYLLYALETWRNWWNAPVTGRIIDRLRAHSQGLYRDGWAAPRLRYMIPPGAGPVEIRGLSPLPQSLTLHSNGASVGRFDVGRGPFQLTSELAGLVNLEIVASSGLRPSSESLNRRTVSWIVRSIGRSVRSEES